MDADRRLVTGGIKAAAVLAMLAVVAVSLTGCGGRQPFEGEPVGTALLPDLAPVPPVDMQMLEKDGKWYISFSSTLVNVGKGDFVLVGRREIREWRVQQGIRYSESGGVLVRVRAPVVWGGDGHRHWHIRRVATMRLVALGADGRPVAGPGRADAKIGFCFFDYARSLKRGPERHQYSRVSCGSEDDSRIAMGLSIGWGDTYSITLPGQRIDVSEVPDGSYRLYAEVDESGWFREASRKNNRTWIDVVLTSQDELRFARVVAVGPKPR
jgi:hypothetical protein